MSTPINYATLGGIHSVAAAAIFAAIYVPLAGLHIYKLIRLKNALYYFVIVFCFMRSSAFALRAVLAASTTAAESLGLFIAQQVCYNSGFLGVVLSTYILCLHRQTLANFESVLSIYPRPLAFILKALRNSHVIHLILATAAILSVVSAIEITSSNTHNQSIGATIRDVSLYVFLAIVGFLLMQAILLIQSERNSPISREQMAQSYSARPNSVSALGVGGGSYVVLSMGLLLLARELFYTQESDFEEISEGMWYGLSAVTELIVIICFAIPGLVPSKDAVKGVKQEYTAELHGRGSMETMIPEAAPYKPDLYQ